ncbi:DNA-3-methyladenine glycosylase 2 family protein [Nisaea sp.]|uniref:DNA-3-methyladenine glycosylase family protein n=1 Tax=Nisaea sp. TaxID=2024842 RepID=UPI0032663339
MTGTKSQENALHHAVIELTRRDPDIELLYKKLGPPPSRREPPGFASLIRILTAQQVSLASASAIWARLNQQIDVTPAAVSRATDEDFKQAGFSRPKVRYARALAEHVLDGRLDLENLQNLDDEAVAQTLTSVPGIGRWTSDIYLLFCLGRLDIWPGGDLAIQEALRALKKLEARPRERDTHPIAEHWRPYRGAAAQLLWQYYRMLKFGGKTSGIGVFPVTDAASP